jgi:glycerate 2-kinase
LSDKIISDQNVMFFDSHYILSFLADTEVLISAVICLNPMPEICDNLFQPQNGIPSAHLIDSILRSALESVDPYHLTSQHILHSNVELGNSSLPAGETQRVFLIAMGKASLAMTRAAVDQLGERITKGVCISKVANAATPKWPKIDLLCGAHPVPNERSLNAGMAVRRILQELSAQDLVIVLVSGGSSALVVDPCEGIALEDIIATNQALLRCGASINEMNCVRKHLERLKGGGLARMAQPARVEALLLSDVIGDDMSVIASGPTVADPTTFAEALNIISKYELEDQLPGAILRHLTDGSKGLKPETLKAEEVVNQNIHSTIIGSNRHAIDAAMWEAGRLGFSTRCVSTRMTGEAAGAGEWFLNQCLASQQPPKQPAMSIAGGETTVTVKGNGLGGRNLHLALAAVNRLSGLKNTALVTLATDGEDGPTDAAGAIVTGDTKEKAQDLGLDPDDFLSRNDSYTFFEKVGGLIRTGPTGTNVNDLTFFFQF